MQIRQATEQTIAQAAKLAIFLWAGHAVEEMQAEFQKLCQLPHTRIFLAHVGDKAIGFAQCQLRRDYVEGCSQSPVGYLEGIYVDPQHRKHFCTPVKRGKRRWVVRNLPPIAS